MILKRVFFSTSTDGRPSNFFQDQNLCSYFLESILRQTNDRLGLLPGIYHLSVISTKVTEKLVTEYREKGFIHLRDKVIVTSLNKFHGN